MSVRHTSHRRIVTRFVASMALCASLTAGVATLAVAGWIAVRPLAAQDRGPASRVVHGRVEDTKGNGLKGAVVYLKDDHTTSVKSAITDDDGSYRFVQLSLNTDYELWAQSGDKKSPVKAISSFDSKPDITIILHIDK